MVLGNLSFSILSIRAHQLGAFIAAFCGAEHGGVGAARLSTSIELRVIHLDSKFTDFLVHSKFNWEHQGAQLPPNKTQLIASEFTILHMTHRRKIFFEPSEFDYFLILMTLITRFLHFVYRRSTLLISPKIRSWWPLAERWQGWHLLVQYVWCMFSICIMAECLHGFFVV